MDLVRSCSMPEGGTKSALRASATTGLNALSALSAVTAPVAARWDAEADRRRQLRTPEHLKALMDAQRAHNSARATASAARSQRSAARKATKNPLSAARRAARTADKAARRQQHEAKAKLAAARRDYPSTLTSLAVRAHAAHAVPAGMTSWLLSTPTDWAVWPASTSAALIAANVAVLALGRRQAAAEVDDEGMTAEERRLAKRLDPSYWVQHADERGLAGTVTTPVEATPAGLVTTVRLDGRWKPSAFKAKHEEVRALLGARTDLRMEIKAGSHGDRATLTLRTRSAADGLDLCGWKPGDAWAVDTVTGEAVPVPLGKRILLAGTSGSGKSTSARPLLAEASERADHRLIVLDRKHIEGRTWEHRARVACELADIRAVVQELIAEGEERLKLLPRGEDAVAISPERPRITVFVDEMAELLSDCAEKYKDENGKSADFLDVIAGLRTVARKYRAAEIILVPATQKPTLSGDGHGLDSQIAGQLTVRLALAVATATETQSVFGNDAIEKGWRAHELPMPWVALMRDQEKGPRQRTNPIRMRWMTAQQVIDLPDRPIWRREEERQPVATPARPTLRLVKEAAPEADPAEELPEADSVVLTTVRAAGRPIRQVEIVKATGVPKGTVSKAVKRLAAAGHLTRSGDGSLTTTTTTTTTAAIATRRA